MKPEAFVSVVVPVYNVERYIGRCIESILQQTHKNLELILINDGSPDRSGEICDEYARKDSRIKVIHTPNRGVSHARNTGLDNTTGDYLFFIDSDDWVEPEHIEKLLPVDDEDMVYGGTKLFRNAVLFTVCTPTAYVAQREEWTDHYEDFLNKGRNIFFIHPCYRLSVIRENHIRFYAGLNRGEDGLFNVSFLEHCRKVRYSETSTYCYEDGDETSNSLSNRFCIDCLQGQIVFCEAVEKMTKQPEYLVRWKSWQSVLLHFRVWRTRKNGIHKEEAKKALKEAYEAEYFRACIPYIRATGSRDQKVESYFLHAWSYPLYKPFYSVIVFLSRTKRFILRKYH